MKRLNSLLLTILTLTLILVNANAFTLNLSNEAQDAIAHALHPQNASINLSGFNARAIGVIRDNFGLPVQNESNHPDFSLNCTPFGFPNAAPCNNPQRQLPRLASGIVDLRSLINRTHINELLHPADFHLQPLRRIDCLPFAFRLPNAAICPAPVENNRIHPIDIVNIRAHLNFSRLNGGARIDENLDRMAPGRRLAGDCPLLSGYPVGSPEYEFLLILIGNDPEFCSGNDQLGNIEIIDLNATPGNTNVTITWNTNIATNSSIRIFNADGELIVLNSTEDFEHFEEIENLQPNTLYNAAIFACTIEGCAVSATQFITNDIIPVIVNVIYVPTNDTINLTYNSNYAVNAVIRVISENVFVARVNSVEFRENNSLLISNLMPNTTYQLIGMFCNAANVCTSDNSFVTTLAVGDNGNNGDDGNVNPNPENGRAPQFEYINAITTSRTVFVKWRTDIAANETFTILDSANRQVAILSNATLDEDHREFVIVLEPNTTYTALIVACNGNCTSTSFEFTTRPRRVNPNGNELVVDIQAIPHMHSIDLVESANKPINSTTNVYQTGGRVIFNKTVNDADYEANKLVELNDLRANQKYRLDTLVCTVENECANSIIFLITLEDPFAIEDIPLQPMLEFTMLKVNVTENTTTIVWSTNLFANYTLNIYNEGNILIYRNESSVYIDAQKEILPNFIPNTTYNFVIKACTFENICNTTSGAYYVNATNASVGPLAPQNEPPAPNNNPNNNPPRHSDGPIPGNGHVIFLKDGCEFQFNADGKLGNCPVQSQAAPITGAPVATGSGNGGSNDGLETKEVNVPPGVTRSDLETQGSQNGANESLIDLAIAALILLLIALVVISTAAYMVYKHKKDGETTPPVPAAGSATAAPVAATAVEEPSKFAGLKEEVQAPAPEAAAKAKK